mgnify:CR=1 FL=1
MVDPKTSAPTADVSGISAEMKYFVFINNDEPKSIVTHGPYAWVRHPFYTSFMMCLTGCVIICPHPSTILTLCYAIIALMVTARREEFRLSSSEFGKEYQEYMKNVGRFFPGVGKVS